MSINYWNYFGYSVYNLHQQNPLFITFNWPFDFAAWDLNEAAALLDLNNIYKHMSRLDLPNIILYIVKNIIFHKGERGGEIWTR